MKEDKGKEPMIKLNFAGIRTRRNCMNIWKKSCSFPAHRERVWTIFMIF